jgi:hypothetical protein
MAIDSGNIIILILILLAIIGYFIIKRFALPGVEKFKLIVSYLGGISVILIAYSIYFNVISTNLNAQTRLAFDTLALTQRQWLSPQEELAKYYPETFFLYQSIFPDNLNSPEPKEFNPSKRACLELYFSNRFYEILEDFLSTIKYDLTSIPIWINCFLTWMQSPILQKNWELLEHCYSPDTREFISHLIKESNQLNELRKKTGKPLTMQDYNRISETFPVIPR